MQPWDIFPPFPPNLRGVSRQVFDRSESETTHCKLKIMNPVVRQILDNIGRLDRKLENSQPNPLQTNVGTMMSNERTVSVEGEVSRIFRRSSAQPTPSIYTSNASFTSSVSNVITTRTLTAAQQRPTISTNSTLTPRFRLSYNFNNSRAGQKLRQCSHLVPGH